MEDIPDTAFNRTIIEAEVIAFIQEQLDSLSPKVRDVIILSLQGLKSHVVAKMTGATRKTVLNQRRTAVMKLREQIKLKFDI